MSKTIKIHPVASLFPRMIISEFKRLKADIKRNGQIEPIVLYKGKIIDGVHRYKACMELDRKPKTRTWNGKGSLLSYIISLNLNRRHLSISQKAMIADNARPMIARESKQRQKTSTGGKNPQLVAKIPQAEAGKTRDKLGRIFGISGKLVDDARTIKKGSSKLAKSVLQGTINISQAKRTLMQQKLKKKLKLPTRKYRIIYADPPWKFGYSERHYPTMTIVQLCEMNVKEITTKNAVLFLWVTSTKLSECWSVIAAWGFNYKASFIWDKVKHNFGYYNSMRHEFLLVCTKGNCRPDNKKLLDSVVEIPRTKHSEKPEYFRTMIDRLYPVGKRIELFARKKTKGWDVYGNEC